MVLRIRRAMPRLGTRKLYYLLADEFQRQGVKVGRDKLFSILRRGGLLIGKKRRYTQTTNSKHWLKKYDNLFKHEKLHRPEQVFVSDITYLTTRSGFRYVSLVTDACSKKIMGYALSESLHSAGCVEALRMALENRITNQPLIHHSDRGLQYCSKDYVEMLNKHKVKISMTANGDPYENAVAERVNGILKDEFYLEENFLNHKQAYEHLRESIEIYNTQRPHLSCQMLTPEKAHQMATLIPKTWKRRMKSATHPQGYAALKTTHHQSQIV